MTPPNKTNSRISVPEFCLPATRSGSSMLAHILRASSAARQRTEAQRDSVVLSRDKKTERSDETAE